MHTPQQTVYSSLLPGSVYSPSCMNQAIKPSTDFLPGSDGHVRPRPERIITPRLHGTVLFEPPAATLAATLAAKPVAATMALTSPDYRSQARQDLLACITQHAQAIGATAPEKEILTRPWILTGHQVEFYHAGVWAKVIAADYLAQLANAVAIDLLVDHDVLAHTGMEVPVMENGHLAKRLISWDDDPPDTAAEFIAAPTPPQRKRWMQAIHSTTLVKSDAWKDFSARLAAGTAPDYVTWMSKARFDFEAALGIHVWHAPCSRLCQKPAWLAFVAAWIAHAEEWTAEYNAALHRYRSAHHIRNAAQPMPDLAVSSQQLELPFWIYGRGQPRSRLMMARGPAPSLVTPAGPVALPAMHNADWLQQAQALGQRLAEHGLAIRPRALTLTMFARLALADVFIHGIGGAIYDQITDQLMESFFRVVPPYGCVSAGWLLDLPGRDEKPASISALRWQHHHLRHNPQLALPSTLTPDAAVAGLLDARRKKIRNIENSLQADRHVGRRCRNGAVDRRHWFRELHQLNAQLRLHTQPTLDRIDRQLTDLYLHAGEITAANWREYFFALHPISSLQALIAAVRGHQAGP